MLKFTR
ncbi:hypothetical protein SUNI508_06289 [Seiridium unicorne]